MSLIELPIADQGAGFIMDIGNILGLSQGETAAFILLLAVFLAILAAILTGAFIPVVSIARFTYPITYVRATGTPFVREEHVFPLMEARTIDEALEVLRGRDIHIADDGLPDLRVLRARLRAWHQREFLALQGSVPSGIQPFFEAIGMEPEIEALKSLIVRKNRGIDPEAIREAVIPVGQLTEERIARMAHAAGIEQLVEYLDGTPYCEPLEETLPRFLNDRLVLPFVAALDRFFYRELSLSVLRSDRSLSEPLQSYVGTRIDLANIATVLTGKAAGLCRERVSEYLLPGGRELDIPLATHMAEAPSVEEALALLDRTAYSAILSPLIHESGTIREITTVLSAFDRYQLEYAGYLGTAYPLGAGPLLEFLAGLDYEMRNIHIALTGIGRGVSPERMKRLAVIRGKTA